MAPEFIMARIKAIQKELDDLTKVLAGRPIPGAETAKLKDIWRGMCVDESDFKDAAMSLFKSVRGER